MAVAYWYRIKSTDWIYKIYNVELVDEVELVDRNELGVRKCEGKRSRDHDCNSML